MKKPMTIMVIILAVVFGGIIGYNLVKKIMIKRYFAHYSPPPVSVSSASVIQQDWHPQIRAVGTFVATQGVDINAEASGNISRIHFQSGQFVKANQPLIDIDDGVEQASLKFNQANATLKAINYKRQQDLYKKGATSSSSLDEAKANLDQAQADIAKIKAQIAYKHITAPFTGRLGIRQVNLGQYITPGQTPIVTLQSQDPVYLQFNLPEQQKSLIHLNQPIEFTIESQPQAVFTGKITAINAKIDPTTHTLLVESTVPNCALKVQGTAHQQAVTHQANKPYDKALVTCNTAQNQRQAVKEFLFIPGMFADITIKQTAHQQVLMVPSTAISYSLYGNSVFVISADASKKDDKGQPILTAKRTFVTIGEPYGNYTIIKEGLKPHDLVVSSGELKLSNNARVTINNTVNLHTQLQPDTLAE